MSKSEEKISMFRLRSIQLNNTVADEAPDSSSSTQLSTGLPALSYICNICKCDN
jgi:hypothetical protein